MPAAHFFAIMLLPCSLRMILSETAAHFLQSCSNLAQRESPARDMRRLALTFLFCGLASATIAAEAEQQPIKPYPPVAITFSAPPDDDSFVRFRAELAA